MTKEQKQITQRLETWFDATKGITLEDAKEIIRHFGGTPLNGASWEDDENIYASSIESDPRCFGHPWYEVQFHKSSGWLSVNYPTGRKSVCLRS